MRLVNDTVASAGLAPVDQLAAHRALEEPTAAVAGQNTIVLARRDVPAHNTHQPTKTLLLIGRALGHRTLATSVPILVGLAAHIRARFIRLFRLRTLTIVTRRLIIKVSLAQVVVLQVLRQVRALAILLVIELLVVLVGALQRWVIAIKTKIQLSNTLSIILYCVICIIN